MNIPWLNIGWHFEESAALSRVPNPLRPGVEQDVAAFLAKGGQITQAVQSPSIYCVAGPAGTRNRRLWAVAPVEVRTMFRESKP